MTAKKHLKMTNPGEVRRAMTRVSNMVLNGEITPQQGKRPDLRRQCRVKLHPGRRTGAAFDRA